ncbi:MAG TPA: DUF1559 domain-containing protein [Gemmataceae bacterium]|nr:DUF1559 domain-containing protein [Gemmataceae bacterium]
MIRFVCECGTQLQAREENAGKAVLCPTCKRQLMVPRSEPTAIQAAEEAVELPPEQPRTQRQRPAIRDEPEEETEDRPRRREQAGSSGKALASLILGIVSLCGCACLTGIPSILLGILSLRDISRAAGMMTGKPMAIIGIVLGSLATLCFPPGYIIGYLRVQDAKERIHSQNNLRQMGLALHNYNDTYGMLPSAGVGDPRKPQQFPQQSLLSWRVAILPYIEQSALYNQFKHDEPWDGPNNIKLLAKMPKIYKLPGDDKTKPDRTHYQVFVGNGAAFEKTQPLRIPADFPDGTSNTIFVAEVEQAVPWTKPDDIPFDPSKPMLPLMSTYFRGGFSVLMVDGSVRVVSRDISEKTLKAAITRKGNEPLGPDW